MKKTKRKLHKRHQEILEAVKLEAKRNPTHSSHDPKSYDGHDDFTYPLNNPQRRKIAKDWIKKHPDISKKEFLNLLNSLYKGKSSDEKSIAGMLLGYLGKLRKEIEPENLDKWLNSLKGWAQVDSLCQSNFIAKDLLHDWSKWERFLIKLSKDKNINKRRASLVFLTRPVRDSDDERLAKLAFKNIDKLKAEKEILITKAISWLLRDMIKNHRKKVESYLKENSESLPKIAIRETKNKLLSGRK